MDKALVHPLTRGLAEQAAVSDHHAFAFIGPYGSGKSYLADLFAHALLGGQPKLNQVLRLTPGAHSIGIDEIRQIQSHLKLKTVGVEKTRRIVIIEDAHTMTIEAQNALLKTLEEPPSDTKIILTINGLTSLRQTVYSRLYQIPVKHCSLADTLTYFEKSSNNYDENDVRTAYVISGGLAGLCVALLNHDDHPLITAISQAKSFLSSSIYERLLRVNEYSKDKDDLDMLLFAMGRVLSAALHAGKPGAQTHESSMKAVYESQKVLLTNTNIKLLLTNLSLQI